MKVVLDRIRRMNEVFDLPSNDFLIDHGRQRIEAFHRVLSDETNELLDVGQCQENGETDLTALADCLMDHLVYVLSECRRWGIPVEPCIDAVLNSQESKLENGKAVMAEDKSKFIKGKHYVAPEPEIDLILQKYRKPSHVA